MTTWYNNVVAWVSTEILSGETSRERAKIFTKFLFVAEKLLLFHNYNSFLAMVHGLGHLSIRRMTNTMKHVDSERFNRIEQIAFPLKNFRVLRELYDYAQYPFIPPLALIFRDLTFIDSGNFDYADNKKEIINVEKLVLFGKILVKQNRNKELPSSFLKVDLIQKFLLNLKNTIRK